MTVNNFFKLKVGEIIQYTKVKPYETGIIFDKIEHISCKEILIFWLEAYENQRCYQNYENMIYYIRKL